MPRSRSAYAYAPRSSSVVVSASGRSLQRGRNQHATEVRLGDGSFIYEGLLDDRVGKYPWTARFTDGYVNLLLRRSALFARPLLINDGYMLHSVGMRHALLDPDGLFYGLMAHGQVIMFSKTHHLEEMPEMERARVKSYDALVSNKRQWRDLKTRLRQLRKADGYHWAQWPALDNRAGFELLANTFHSNGVLRAQWNVAGRDGDGILDKAMDRFRQYRQRNGEVGARTHWEDVALTVTVSPRRRARLMHLGNEIYHFNMAAMISSAAGSQVAVSTRFNPGIAAWFAGGQAQDMQSHLRIPASLATLPDKKFAAIFGITAVRDAKQLYLDAVDMWKVNQDRIALEQATLRYSEALGRGYAAVAASKGEDTKTLFGTTAAGAVLSGAAKGASGSAGVAFGALGIVQKLVSPAHLLAVWRTRKLKKEVSEILSPKERVFHTVATAGRMTATIALDPAVIRQHV